MTSMTDNADKPQPVANAAPMSQAQEAKLEALIGHKLRSYFDELMAEPVPSRILDLLQELDAKERAEEDKGPSGGSPDKSQ